jgi:hypothetical protein
MTAKIRMRVCQRLLPLVYLLGSGCFNLGESALVGPEVGWAVRAGGSDNDLASALATSDGWSLVAGTFVGGDVVFGPGESGETTLHTFTTGSDLFVARYDPGGGLSWVQKAGSTDAETVGDVRYSNQDIILAIGSYKQNMAFYFGADDDDNLPKQTEGSDMYLASFMLADGAFDWAVPAGGPGHQVGTGMVALEGGASLLVGTFEDAIEFDPEAGVDGGLDSGFEGDPGECHSALFVARYAAEGVFEWADRSQHQDGCVTSVTIEVRRDQENEEPFESDAILVGTFADHMLMEGSSGNHELTSHEGTPDAFVAKYDAEEGFFDWAVHGTGAASDHAADVAIFPGEDWSLVVVGSFESDISLSDGTQDFEFTSQGLTDGFVAHLGSDGTLLESTFALGGSGTDAINGVAAVSDGTFLVCGSFSDAVDFGDIDGEPLVLVSAGDRDAFVAQYDTEGNLLWAHRAGGSGPDEAIAVEAVSSKQAIVVGNFWDKVVFGKGGPREVKLTSAGRSDVFLMRLKWGEI